ncbi:hypothetical protein MMC20_000872 [Loxospora ochrophaea]|nr:hypothetical protein [Loxospora ochrophaea]
MSEPSQAITTAASPKTVIRIGDVHYDIDVSKIPYLSSFVNFQANAQPETTEFVHGPLPLFDHHTLCKTYELLCIDVLGGQTINEIFNDLRSGKYDDEPVKANRAKARDTAFRLLYLMLLGEFQDEAKDSAKIFNAVLFVVSHSATFKWRTRKVLRAAYEERFVISTKQKARLDQWEKTDAAKLAAEDAGDVTTEEESDCYYDSDYSL